LVRDTARLALDHRAHSDGVEDHRRLEAGPDPSGRSAARRASSTTCALAVDQVHVPDRDRPSSPPLPFCTARRHASWRPHAYPSDINHLGDHVRGRRLDLGLQVRDAATQMGVHSTSVTNWERRRRQPSCGHLSAVIRFLGYDPRPIPVVENRGRSVPLVQPSRKE